MSWRPGLARMKESNSRRSRDDHSLTALERVAVDKVINLADGHARHLETPYEQAVKRDLSKLYRRAEKAGYAALRQQFLSSYCDRSGQASLLSEQDGIAMQPSASLSIEIIANVLRKIGKTLRRPIRIGLIHPTFDNIASILRRHDVNLVPVEEPMLRDGLAMVEELDVDGLFLVLPNNPTGFEVSSDRLRAIARTMRKNDRMLIVDSSFRWFGKAGIYDQYAIFREVGVEYMTIEDTGKAWPSLELKLGFVACSSKFRDEVRVVQNDLLLGVSPFCLALNGELLGGQEGRRFLELIRRVVSKNREYLQGQLERTEVAMAPFSSSSVAWLKLPDSWSSDKLCDWLRHKSIHVLPGGPFFWAGRDRGQSWIRIALMRPPQRFQSNVAALAAALSEYNKGA